VLVGIHWQQLEQQLNVHFWYVEPCVILSGSADDPKDLSKKSLIDAMSVSYFLL